MDDSSQSLLDMQNEAKKEADKERFDKLFVGKNPFEHASIWQKMFFNWTAPVLSYAKKNQLDIKQLGKVRHSDSVEVQLAKLEAAWERRKNIPGEENGLSKALFAAFKGELCYAIFWNFVVTILQLMTPFLLRNIILFIQNKEADTTYGVTLLSILMVSQGISFFIREHMTLYQRMTGFKATNALIAMILEKQFKVSPATNKTFTQGELINFV
jgi:ABC-type multidrug transport system fused ATPase/permease subunit